jgi:hypothetical protein
MILYFVFKKTKNIKCQDYFYGKDIKMILDDEIII